MFWAAKTDISALNKMIAKVISWAGDVVAVFVRVGNWRSCGSTPNSFFVALPAH